MVSMEPLVHSRILGRFLVSIIALGLAGVFFGTVLSWQGRRLGERLDERNRLIGLTQQRVGAGAQSEAAERSLRTVEGKLGAPLSTIKAALEQKLVASGREQVTATMQRVAQTQQAVLFLEQADERSLNGQWQGSLESFAALLRELANVHFVGQLNRLAISVIPVPAVTAAKASSLYRFTFTVSLP